VIPEGELHSFQNPFKFYFNKREDFYAKIRQPDKFLVLDYFDSPELIVERLKFKTILVPYLKKKYGPDVLFKLNEWQKKDVNKKMPFAVFLMDEYNVKTNIYELSEELEQILNSK